MWADLEARQAWQRRQLSTTEPGVTLQRRTGCEFNWGCELLDLNQMGIPFEPRDSLSSVEFPFDDDEASEVGCVGASIAMPIFAL